MILAGLAALSALTAAGCRQNASGTPASSPWASAPPAASSAAATEAAKSAAQQQYRTLSDLWRRQNDQFASSAAELQRRHMEQLNQLQSQTQQQIQLAEQRKTEELERQAQLARARQADLSELEQLRRHAMQLDANNRDMHAQLAKSQQESRLLDDQVKALNKRLGDTANQLALALRAREESERRAVVLEASTRQRGGATITANNSMARSLTAISIPGIQVRQDGDVVRMELPSDQVFLPGTATLNPAAFSLLDQVSQAIAQHYPRQIIGVEGHTDSDPPTGTAWATSHRLSVDQAMALLDHLGRNPSLSARQLSAAGHGSNYPLASNATPAGKARNRRVEIVVYPETVDGR